MTVSTFIAVAVLGGVVLAAFWIWARIRGWIIRREDAS